MLELESLEDWIKSNSAVPGGSLTSTPTWWRAFGRSITSTFFMSGGASRTPLSCCETIRGIRDGARRAFRLETSRMFF